MILFTDYARELAADAAFYLSARAAKRLLTTAADAERRAKSRRIIQPSPAARVAFMLGAKMEPKREKPVWGPMVFPTQAQKPGEF